MTLRMRLFPLALAVGSLILGAEPAPASLCAFDDIVIFGFNSVHISRNASATGDVVANSESPGPVLDEGAEVAIDRGATVQGNVSGHTIDLDAQSTITGNATYVELVNAGTITGAQTIGAPPYTDFPAFLEASIRLECANVFVPAGAVEILGDEDPRETCYGDIVLEKGATVVFSGGGRFDVRSIGASSAAPGQCPGQGQTYCRTIEFDAPTELRVEGRIHTERATFVGPAAGSGLAASDIVIYAGGSNGGLGGPLNTPFAVNIGRESGLQANIYAPNGTIEIDRATMATGALLGRDVELQAGVVLNLDSAFFDQPPTADAQSVDVATADPVTIELTGSDPEGDDLTFSIEVPPSQGTLGPITPIQDPGQCSETVQVCNADPDCPGSETCVLPPISRATVDFQFGPGACSTDPEGEVTCPADAFTFGVKDSCDTLATAVVSINPDDPSGPPPPVNQVIADDIEIDVVVGSSRGLLLSAGAPPAVSLTFTVMTLPSSGSLEDEGGNPITVVPHDLTTPVVVYNAPGAPGPASFVFAARDSTTLLPCLAPNCDTGTVNITVGVAPELAQDLSVETGLNEPVPITLVANPDGTGTGGPSGPAQQSASGPAYTYFYEAQAIGSGAGNGTAKGAPGSPQTRTSGAAAVPQPLAAQALIVDAGWSATSAVPPAFFWTGGNGTFADDNYTFSLGGPGCLSVTDDFQKGDQFRVYDNGSPIFTTSAVAVDFGGLEVGPDAAYLDSTYSSGSFGLGSGAHDITIEVIVSPFGTGRGYIRVDSGPCLPNLEVTSLSAPDTAFLNDPIGGQIQTTVRNSGFAAIPAGTLASIGYYISSDAVIDTSDRLLSGGRENLSQQAPNGLAVGESVQINLFSGASVGSQFPDENPLLGNVFIGVLVDEFGQVSETDETDNTASEPITVSVDGTQPLTFTIQSLPLNGTLTFGGAPVQQFQTFSLAPTLVFTPTVGFSGSTSFNYSVTKGAISDTALVSIVVSLSDNCTPVGREPGCAPGGGGSAPISQAQAELEREVAAGPSKGLTVTIEGAGSVASSPVMLSRNRVLFGLICHGGTCNKRLPEGAEIQLFARPEGDDSEFVRWRGACSGNEPITSVVMTEHTECTAVFGPKFD